MSIDYNKFDKQVDLEGLKIDMVEVEKNGGDYKNVPQGEYEVTVNKMELGESKKGDPMVSIWFKILEGEFKGSIIFYNQVITQAFQIHIVNELLRTMTDGGGAVKFESYYQYAQMLMDIHETIDGNLEFAMEYGETNKGFPTFKIVEVFEVEK